MKKISTFSLLILLVCVCFIPACDHKETTDSSFIIGHPSGSSHGSIVKNINSVAEASGGKFLVEVCDPSPIETLLAVGKLIEDGCDGILLMPTAEYILPQVAEMCDEANVYWVIIMRSVQDPQILDLLFSSEYFVGMVMENDEATGYELMKTLGKNGKKHVVLVSPIKTDPVGEARERGIYRAAEEYGMEIVAEIRNAKTKEQIYHSLTDTLIARPDIDAVFRVGSYYYSSTEIMQAIEESGRADVIQYVTIDFERMKETSFRESIVPAVAGGHKPLDVSLAASLLINSVMGTPVSETPVKLTIDYVIIRTEDELIKYNEFMTARDGILFSADFVKENLLKSHNPHLNIEYYEKIIKNYTVERLHDIENISN